MEERILRSGTEAAATLPPLPIRTRLLKPSPLASQLRGKATDPASPKSSASTPYIPISYSVSCGVYVTVCPLACKQKAQPEPSGAWGRHGGPSAAPAAVWAPQAWAELSVSSATCCSRVLQLLSGKEGLRGRRALRRLLLHLRSPAPGAQQSPLPPGARGRRPRARGARRRRAGRQGALGGLCAGAELRPLLLTKANTALFFPDRANAPGTSCSSRGSASSGEALGVQSRSGPIPETPPRPGGARRPAGGPPAAEAASAPSAAPGLLKRTRSLDIRCPHSWRRTPRGRRAAGSFPGAATASDPAGPGPGNFRCLEPRRGDPQPDGGTRQGRAARAAGEGGARGKQEAPAKSGDVLRAGAESRRRRRLLSREEVSGMEKGGPLERRRRKGSPGDGRTSKLRGRH